MATELFKDGQSILVDPTRITAHLDQGWTLTDPNGPVVTRLEVIYPEHIKPSEMSETELQSAILKEMGIEIKHPEPAKQPAKKRGRPRKAA